ncbi:MFS transporter [Candidatus Woesearchaeota archaeon]|nr:MFS transporter [Candidatus Woesearchaeota archaeon]
MKKKFSLGALLFVVFIDLVGIGIIIPILPLVLLESSMTAGLEDSIKTFLTGLLLASYPFAQFFGAPILGALSDKHGRKPILILSMIGAFFGYTLFAFGLLAGNIFFLFISRILAGFTAGNIAVVKSIIADTSDEKSKVKNFGLVGVAFGLGFILGPFLGGVLSNSSLIPWFGIETPFWFAALLLFANIGMVLLLVKETLPKPSNISINLLTGLKNVKKAVYYPNLRIVFLSYFLFMFGFTFFTQFFPVFLYDRFSYTPSQIGLLFAYVGLWIAFAQGIMVRPIAKRFKPHAVLRYSMLAIPIVLLLLLIPEDAHYLYFILPLMALANGLNLPNFSALFSNLASKSSQGEILGIEQSLLSLAMIVPPVIAGIAAAVSSSLPILLGSLFVFTGWAVFALFYKEKRKEVFEEV